MTSLSRVVWSEGMHLAQHHFQAQARYFEELTSFAVRSLFFEPWGLASCDLDAEALLNGTVSLNHASGILPDGLIFTFPEDGAPQPIDVRERFSPTEETQLIHLAIPAYRAGGANTGADARFSRAVLPVADEITGDEAQQVAVARKNFRLLLQGEPTDGLVTMPIARVRRDGSGHFIYDPDYVPPCVRIGASTRLLALAARLVELLGAKADALRAERAAASGAGTGYASREVAAFWLSHALHSTLPALRGLLEARSCHPEQLFTELARLGGALCTFALASHPRMLPLYDHNDLGGCFGALDEHIRHHLEVVLPTGALTVPLTRAEETFYTADVVDARCYKGAHWFLGVRSTLSQGELAARVPRLVKVCSARFIERLVREAHPALDLQPVATPPAAISPRFDTQYFTIQAAGPCWKSIQDTHQVGVYAPAAVPDAELELCILLPQG
jgi:type VI secretion system protein ImpJ